MATLKIDNFKGTNTEQENLAPNILPFAFNVDTSKGRLAARDGYTSLLDLSTTGSPKGIHTASFSGGDTIVVGADDKAFKLSGTADTEVVTTTAEFALGTFTNTEDGTDKVIQDEYFDATFQDTTYTLTSALESFTSSVQFDIDLETDETDRGEMYFYDASDVEQFRVYRYVNESGPDRLRIYEFGVQVYENTDSTPDTFTETIKVVKTADSVEFYSSEQGGLFYTSTTSFNDIKKVVSDSTGSTGDFNIINFYIAESLTGEYVSKIFDLAQTPVANTLSFNTTTAGEGTITMYARGSSDGVRFGDWGIVSTGDSIPLNRYIQVRALFARTDLTVMSHQSLDDFTISYTTSFDTKTQFDSGLTGNKIRWVNYQGQENTTTGTIVIATNPKILTVADGTGFAIGQTIIIDGAGLSGADLITTVTNVAGTTITINDNASTDVTNAYVLIELYETKQYVYYCDGTTVAKYDGTTATDIDTVISANVIYEHKNYMFYVSSVDPSRLYFSDVYGTTQANPLGDFENVGATSYKKFPDEIKALKTFGGKLVVSGEKFTAFVTGDIFGGVSDDTVVYIIDDIGAVNHESMSICISSSGTILSVVTKDGVRYLTGSTYENALEQVPLSDTVRTYIDEGNFDAAYSYYADSKLYVGFNSGVVPADYIDSMLVFDFTRGLTIDGIWDIALNDICEFAGKLYGSSSDTTKLFELLSGTDDDGSDIDFKAVMRLDLGEAEATLHRMKVIATTDSDFDNPTSCDIIVSADNHSRTLDMKQATWRESTTYYSQFKGQDLMESKRSVKKRGTFIEINVVALTSYKLEFNSFYIEYEGGRR